MDNRLTNFLLLVIVVMGCYWFWKQPETRGDMERAKNVITSLGDKTVEAAAKVSNKIEDSEIGERTKEAIDHARETTMEKSDKLKRDFDEAKEKDRAEGGR